MSKLSWGSKRLVAAVVVGCLAPLAVAGAVSATFNTVATAIRVDSIVTPGVTIPQTADAPSIWVAADTPFTVSATFVDANGNPAPLSTTKSTTVTVVAKTPNGDVSLGSVTVAKNVKSVSFSRTLTADIDDAFLRLSAPGAKTSDPPRTGDSGLFDVQSEFSQSDSTTTFDLAIGGTVQGTSCTPTPAEPICFEVHIPAGAASGNHLLSLGNCNLVNPCKQDLDYWWSLVEVNATRDNPAVVDMGVDKSLKQLSNGVPKTKWLVRASGSTVWVEAPPCPRKGVVGPDQDFCHDVTSGHRDNSGDTWVRLLWLRDIRGSIK